MTKQTQTITERQEETARLIAEARAALERLHEERGNALLRGEADTVAANRATVARVEANLADLVTLQARLEVEAAAERVEAERARKVELQQKLEAADLRQRASRKGIEAAVAALGQAVNAAREASGTVAALRAEVGLSNSSVDHLENAVLAELVAAGVVDSRSLGVSMTLLRRLADGGEEQQRRREAEAKIREAAARTYEDSPETIRRRLAHLRTKVSSYKADMRQGYLKSIAEKITKTEGEIAALEQKLGEIAA